jgi:hypothetical protein
VVVLAGFGFTAYELERGRQLRRIDDELQRRIGVLGNALHRPPPRRRDEGEQPFDRPPPGQFQNDGPPGQNFRPPAEFHLPEQDVHFFDTSDPHSFYFSITSREDKLIAHSDNFEWAFTEITQIKTSSVIVVRRNRISKIHVENFLKDCLREKLFARAVPSPQN